MGLPVGGAECAQRGCRSSDGPSLARLKERKGKGNAGVLVQIGWIYGTKDSNTGKGPGGSATTPQHQDGEGCDRRRGVDVVPAWPARVQR